MKRETLRHPKLYDLMGRLQCDRPTALGYLQLLWDYTGEVAPQGNIGKWSDAAIAAACDWHGDAAAFVCDLVDAGWLDRVEEHRLLVHDWGDHCERWVRAKLQRAGLETLAVSTPCTHCARTVDPSGALSNPIQSNPNQSRESLSAEADDPSPELLDLERGLIADWNRLDGITANRGETLTSKRRRMFRARVRSPDWLQEARDAMAKFPLRCQVDAAGKVMADAWKPDLEWFLAPDSVTKILEGKYDFSKANGNGNVRQDSPARIR